MIDQTQNKELLKGLEDFGLSEKEAQVYLALLPRRDVGSSKLVLATGLHKQFVYNALNKLEELGLSKHVIQNGRKKFSASTPTRIISLLEEKKLSAQAMVRQLQERYSGAHEQDFEVFQGESAVLAHQYDLLERVEKDKEAFVICGPTETFLAMIGPDEADEFEKRRVEKGLSIRYLGMESMRERLIETKKWRKLFEYRILPGGQSTGLLDMDIWPDNITLNIFGDPVLTFTITNKAVAEGYREFFESLWRLSKPE
jgi:sugar-specific transcriptional regulator TrmB